MSKPKPNKQPKASATFYSEAFTADELALVAAFVAEPSPDDEIWMLRVLNRRLFRYLNEAERDEPLALATLVKVAGALGAGAVRVARLLRERQALSGSGADSLKDVMTHVLDELSKELGTPL